MKTTYENETTKQAGEAEVMQKIKLGFRSGEVSEAFYTANPDKAKRIHNAKEYFEVK